MTTRWPEQLEKSEDIAAFLAEVQEINDRSCAILAAAFLETNLEYLLRNFLVDAPRILDQAFGSDRLLGTFGGKIQIAFLVGLLSEEQHSDLKRIKDIRNSFAHELQGLTFDDQRVESRCRQLQTYRIGLGPEERITNRDRFLTSVIFLSSHLKIRGLSIANAPPGCERPLGRRVARQNTNGRQGPS